MPVSIFRSAVVLHCCIVPGSTSRHRQHRSSLPTVLRRRFLAQSENSRVCRSRSCENRALSSACGTFSHILTTPVALAFRSSTQMLFWQVVLTNHMTTQLRQKHADDVTKTAQVVPALGSSWGHFSAFRVRLETCNKHQQATFLKSPVCDEKSVPFQITVASFACFTFVVHDYMHM